MVATCSHGANKEGAVVLQKFWVFHTFNRSMLFSFVQEQSQVYGDYVKTNHLQMLSMSSSRFFSMTS